MSERYLWGVDLGGTKIEVVVLDNDNNLSVVARNRIPTCASEGYDRVIAQIKKLIDQTQNELKIVPTKIGFGTPGKIDRKSKKLVNSNAQCMNYRPLIPDLEQALNVKVTIENDANCFAVSEAHYLRKNSMPDAEVVFGVIMGTGVGGGLVINGKLISGIQGIAGEWGHNFLDESGGMCYCGRIGCVETLISGPSLEAYYASISGVTKKLKDVVTAYRSGNDPHAQQTMKRLFHFFGKGISTVINTIDPDAIIIGGGVGNIDELYTFGLEEAKKFVFNDYVDTKLIKPKLGDSSGVFGAALL